MSGFLTTQSLGLLVLAILEAVVIVALLLRNRDRERLARARLDAEMRVRLIVDHAPVMIWTSRPDASLDYLNNTCVEFTGVPLERLLERGWLETVHPDDLDRIVGIYTPAVEDRMPFWMEYRMRRPNGAYSWVLDIGVPHYGPDGTYVGFMGSTVDITERRKAEDLTRESQAALEASRDEIRRLAGRLIEARDAERTRIARDLHDDVSQQVAGISIALSRMRHRLAALGTGEEVQEELRDLHERAGTLAQNIRHISHDLHPTVLQHAGLAAALGASCADIERLHGKIASCIVEGDIASIAPEAALSLYRIAQEALRNVVAHAGARRIDVRLLRVDGHAELSITDDGCGFEVDSHSRRGSGLGLVSITERARLARGTVSLASTPGNGTTVRVRIPMTGNWTDE
jgi:PAS domain S-box-containing protein